MFISRMLIIPSFKKSLIVEQFQGNYLKLIKVHSRPQRPRSFWSAPRIATSGHVQRHSGFEWICKHNRLKPEPIRFVRLYSEHAQSDGKSVNRGLRPEVAILGADQKERGLWGREWLRLFLSIALRIPTAHNFCVISARKSARARKQRKSAIHGLPVTLRMLRVKSDKSDWFCSIVFTKPFKTRMSLDLARGTDFSSAWHWGQS